MTFALWRTFLNFSIGDSVLSSKTVRHYPYEIGSYFLRLSCAYDILLLMYGIASIFDIGFVCFKNLLWTCGDSFGTIMHNFFPSF